MSFGKFTRLLAPAAIVIAMATPVHAQSRSCGHRVNDWCPATANDPCGRHSNVEACKADPACYGRPYTGESMVRCSVDARGFGSNCPTVGCTSTPPSR